MGAWIETVLGSGSGVGSGVAPHVGAWIETLNIAKTGRENLSLPMWERGLKRPYALGIAEPLIVAPHVGAWIETTGTP